MTIFKDLLYDKENNHLDISRVCSLFAVIGFLALSFYLTYTNNAPTLTEYGIGWGGVAAGSAGWIYMRQRIENGMDTKPTK